MSVKPTYSVKDMCIFAAFELTFHNKQTVVRDCQNITCLTLCYAFVMHITNE